ncbi:DUF4097 family beta strand repeat-containing protein [Clostridium hydrogenum]|uniref:DUF4097 family beta strand repeat-containing protein n=1 Tax=Clostridium hydrogenum TaxID=2855764 RepID=UPI001F46DEEF|nr:DUF4097 family beta strand repeat-containing protein [Clostridium hydrogenum]
MKDKRIIKFMIAVFVFVVVALTAVLFYGTNHSMGDFLIVRGHEKIQKQQSLALDGYNKINIDLSSDNVEIETTDSPKLKVVQTAYNKLKDEDKFTVEKNGDEINIKRKVQEFRSFFSFDFRINEKVYIYLPRSYDKNLSINCSSGNVNFMSDIKLNELDCDESSGNIKSEHEIQADKVSFTASSGNEEFEKLKSDSYNVNASSGNIEINSLSGAGKVEARSGNIQIKYEDIKDEADVEASSGNVSLTVPSDLSFEFNGQCSSGDINSNFNMNKDEDGKEATAKVGKAPYKKISARTSSGNIRIDK